MTAPFYLMTVWHVDGFPDLDAIPEAELQASYARVGAFNTELQKSGNWVFGGGLEPPATATTIAPGGTVTDGPFTESKESLGGFWVIRAADLDAALEIARRAGAACGGTIEVRPFASVDD